ncbi:MAG: hypothetical protein R6X32_06270 [Chloroflexota bacterium]
MSEEKMNDTQLEQFLAETLGNLERPTLQTLAEYDLGLLPPKQTETIRRHLEQHPHAAAQLDALRHLWQSYQPQSGRAASPPADSSPLQALSLWLADKVTSSTTPGRPALAGVRGQADMVYQAGPVQLVLDVDDDPQQPGHKSLTGLLLGLPDGNWLARLWPTEESSQEWETAVASDNSFLFDGLPPGHYSLLIRSQTQTAVVEIYIESLAL